MSYAGFRFTGRGAVAVRPADVPPAVEGDNWAKDKNGNVAGTEADATFFNRVKANLERLVARLNGNLNDGDDQLANAIGDALDNKVNVEDFADVLHESDVVNVLNSLSLTQPLSAAMGKQLADRINGLGDIRTVANAAAAAALTDLSNGDLVHIVNNGSGKWVRYQVAAAGDGTWAGATKVVIWTQDQAPSSHSHVAADITDLGSAATKNTGVSAGQVPVMDVGGKYPAADGSQITGISATLTDASVAGDVYDRTDIASHASGTTDIGALATIGANITGTNPITSFGAGAAGKLRFVRFNAALTLTHHATSMVLPTGANIVTAAGDHCWAYSPSSGNWIVFGYTRASGHPVIGSVALQGKTMLWIPASAMFPRITNGAQFNSVELSSNKNNLQTFDFDTTTQEFVQFEWTPPKSWNLGTVTFRPVLSHAATTTNFGMVFALQGLATSDDDAMDAAFGTEQTSTKTGGTTNDRYVGPESAAITIAGTPAAADTILFQLKRNPSDGADTLAIDARLHGIWLIITTDKVNDA